VNWIRQAQFDPVSGCCVDGDEPSCSTARNSVSNEVSGCIE
jgi:hypothetical protein